MADFSNFENIENEDELELLLKNVEDLEIRRKIRRKQSVIRQKRTAEWEAQRNTRIANGEDALSLRLRQADEDKQRKLRDFEQQAREKKDEIGAGELALRERHAAAEKDRQKRIEQLVEMGRVMTSTYNIGVGEFLKNSSDDSPSKATITPESISSANIFSGEVRGNNKSTKTVQQRNMGGVQYSFKPANAGSDDKTNPSARPLDRNPSAVKQVLLDWCKDKCQGYENVNVTNFSTSWADGLAFCALIHHFFPNAFDFSKLNAKNRRGNFTLAFNSAEKLADIAPLLDVEDMVRMKSPDWKCVFTYVQSFYRHFELQKQRQLQTQQ